MTGIIVEKLPFLTPEQFDWAVKEMDLKPSIYDRLYQAMVDGKPIPELAVETGKTTALFYTQMGQVVAELNRRLKEHNKTVLTVFVDKDVAKEVRALETL